MDCGAEHEVDTDRVNPNPAGATSSAICIEGRAGNLISIADGCIPPGAPGNIERKSRLRDISVV
jgi:hypothetical protein